MMKRYRTCRTRRCVLNAALAFCRVVKDRHATRLLRMRAGCVHRKLKLRGGQKTHLRCILYDGLIDGGSPMAALRSLKRVFWASMEPRCELATAVDRVTTCVFCTNP
jgi:hypothetical protein